MTKQGQTSPRQRKNLSGEKKFAILNELKINSGNRSAILRREGLFSADVQRYEETARKGAIKALNESRPGRKKTLQEVPVEEFEKLKRDLERKEKALVELSVEFTILKKKVNGE